MPVIPLEISPKQFELIQCTDKVAAARGGRGSGKSYIVSHWLRMRMRQYPKGQHAVIGPDYPTLKRGFRETFTKILDACGEPWKFNKDEMTLTFTKSGARLLFLSAELQERIRSLELDTVVCDEIAVWKNGEEVYKVVTGSLRPSPGAKMYHPDCRPLLRMVFNPPMAGHWLHEKIETQKAFKCWKMSTRENTVGFNTPEMLEDYIDNLETNISPDRWGQEIEGDWGTLGGGVYRGWDFEVHTKPPTENLAFEKLRPKPLLWSLDFNVAHMASVIGQHYKQKKISDGFKLRAGTSGYKETFHYEIPGFQQNIFIIHDEIHMENAGVPEVAQEFLSRYKEHAQQYGVIIYGDASGGQRNQAMTNMGPNSNWDVLFTILRQAGIKFEYRIQSKNPPVINRINSVKKAFLTKAGVGILVNPKCQILIRDFTMVQYRQGTNEIDKRNNDLTHMSDSLGYLLWLEDALLNKEHIEFQSFLGR